MAIDIIIHLTDAEQAKVSGWIDLLKPGLTNAEKLALLREHCRKLLRDDLIERLTELQRQQQGLQQQRDAQEQRQANVDAIPVTDPLRIVPPEKTSA